MIVFGCYDTSKPRVRLLIQAFQTHMPALTFVHYALWENIRDKAVLSFQKIGVTGLKMAYAYPSILLRYLFLPRQQFVLLPYPGYIEAPLIYIFARLRGEKILLDAFLSIYDTVVLDRKMVKASSITAKLILQFERLVLKCAHLIITDTQANANFFADTYNITLSKFIVIPVGAEEQFWANSGYDNKHPFTVHPQISEDTPIVLFYGQMIPLHGIHTIIEAIRILADEPIFWIIVGSGQVEHILHDLHNDNTINNFRWIRWINYVELPHLIDSCTICLGIFGDTPKAARVVPNKVHQILARGKPVITRDSPALREILDAELPCFRLISSASPEKLAATIVDLIANKNCMEQTHYKDRIPLEKVDPGYAVKSMVEDLL